MAEPASQAVLRGARYDGADPAELARVLHVPRVEVYDEVGSTLDEAHALAAEGAPEGTLVLADAQRAGRGRLGRSWRSERGRGIWLTLVERPPAGDGLDVLSLRIGLHAADALDAFVDEPVRLKWPNDLYAGDRKLAGILLEARWRESWLDWVAIGFGLNVRPPEGVPEAAGLRAGTSRLDVLRALVPAIRRAASGVGHLTATEQAAFARRDLAHGRPCLEPRPGIVAGIDATGALLVHTESGREHVRSGSLVLAPPDGASAGSTHAQGRTV